MRRLENTVLVGSNWIETGSSEIWAACCRSATPGRSLPCGSAVPARFFIVPAGGAVAWKADLGAAGAGVVATPYGCWRCQARVTALACALHAEPESGVLSVVV